MLTGPGAPFGDLGWDWSVVEQHHGRRTVKHERRFVQSRWTTRIELNDIKRFVEDRDAAFKADC